jgi:hypothetical protein
MKMHPKNSKSDVANVLCDIELFLEVFCNLPLLECVHTLLKIGQNKRPSHIKAYTFVFSNIHNANC